MNSLKVVGQRIDKRASSTKHVQMKAQVPVALASLPHLVKLQQQFGNRHVMRKLAERSYSNANSSFVQRDDTNAPVSSEPDPTSADATKPSLKEATVPIPPQHPVKTASSTGGETAIAPEKAKIRVPINFDYHLLPPEIQIRLLDEFSLTAKVTGANLQWQRERLKLG